VDFATLIPALIQLGPTGLAIAVFMWLYTDRGKELKDRDDALKDRDMRISTLQDARLADHKAMLEARINDNREMQRVVSEASASIGRVTDALKTVTETTAEIASMWHVEREVERREAERGRTATSPADR
jgi:hypothetical protein